jgi:hypothetical protein
VPPVHPHPSPLVPWPAARLPRLPFVATVVLTLLVTGAGLLPWPRPALSQTSAWMVSDVPGPLWALVPGATVLCTGVFSTVTARALGRHPRGGGFLAWSALVLVTAAARVWNALSAAALSTTSFGAVIPMVHWLFTFAPAVLAGWLFTRRGRQARMAALTLLGSLTLTAPIAVAPFVGAVAIAG